MSKYYAVRVGKVPGIYRSWADCQKQVIGYKGAIYKSFTTEFEALSFLGKSVSPPSEPTIFKQALYVDGGHNKQTGKEAWACVVNHKGKDMIAKYDYLFIDEKTKDVVLPVGPRTVLVANYSDVTSQQNNGAELLAMWAALIISVHESKYTVICSDSSLIVDHWSKRLNPAKQMCARKKELVLEVIELRKEFEARGGSIVKIRGDDNPADLGYH